MLILTLRIGESLMVGDEVTVAVLGVKGNQVRIWVKSLLPSQLMHVELIATKLELTVRNQLFETLQLRAK